MICLSVCLLPDCPVSLFTTQPAKTGFFKKISHEFIFKRAPLVTRQSNNEASLDITTCTSKKYILFCLLSVIWGSPLNVSVNMV